MKREIGSHVLVPPNVLAIPARHILDFSINGHKLVMTSSTACKTQVDADHALARNSGIHSGCYISMHGPQHSNELNWCNTF